MERALLETLFLCGNALLVLLEIYYFQNFKSDRKVLNAQKKKRTFLFMLLSGIQVVPFIYVFSIDLGPTDYHIWRWLGYPVMALFIFFIWLFCKALADLGRWWTPGLELKDDLELVRTGAFFYIRHPMYVALSGIAVCQVFMIQNWIAGPVSLLLAAPFLIYQIRREERLLIRFFGDDYRHYMLETGMLWPKEDRIPFLVKVARQIAKDLGKTIVKWWNLKGRIISGKPKGSMDGSL